MFAFLLCLLTYLFIGNLISIIEGIIKVDWHRTFLQPLTVTPCQESRGKKFGNHVIIRRGIQARKKNFIFIYIDFKR